MSVSSPAVDFFAGCLGGVAGVLVGHPLDTVKVKLQTQGLTLCNQHQPRGGASSVIFYRGTFHCLYATFKSERFSGLYRGMASPLMCLTFVNAIVFGVYGNLSRALGNERSLVTQMTCGAVAGLAQAFLTSPMELIKSRKQIGAPGTSVRDLLRSGQLFKGLGATAARDGPAFGVYFATYQACLDVLDEQASPSMAKHLIAGGVAGQASWAVVYPLDVAKTRIQVCPERFRRIIPCLWHSARDEGWRVLFAGLTPTLVRAFPVNGVTFAVVSYTLITWDKLFDYKT